MRFHYVWATAAAFSALAAANAALAACSNPAPASAQEIQSFRSDPPALLNRFSAGGAGLVTAVRNLAVSDEATAAAITGLAAGANDAQRSAIGVGLGQAAAACAPRNAAAALAIQQAIVAANNPAVSIAFQAVTGDSRTAATAQGGFGGGGGALGGAGLGVTASGQAGPSAFVRTTNTVLIPNSPFTFSVGSGSSVIFQSTIAATSSVSP